MPPAQFACKVPIVIPSHPDPDPTEATPPVNPPARPAGRSKLPHVIGYTAVGLLALGGTGVTGWKAWHERERAAELSRNVDSLRQVEEAQRQTDAALRQANEQARRSAGEIERLEQIAKQFAQTREQLSSVQASEQRLREAESAVRTQRDQVQRKYDQAYQLARTLLLDVSRTLADLPEAGEARSLVIRNALEYLDRAAPQSTDVALRQDFADAYLRVGRLQAGSASADPASAVASYDKGLSIFAGLFEANPQDERNRRGLVAGRLWAGEALESLSKLADAARSYAKAGELSQRFGNENLDDAHWKQSARAAFQGQGRIEMKSGRPAEAVKYFESALESARALAAIETSASDGPELAIAHRDLAEAYAATRNLENARSEFQQAIESARRAIERNPADAGLWRALARTYESSSAHYASLQQPEPALADARRAMESREKVAELSPADVNELQALASAAGRVGDLQKSAGQISLAIDAYRKQADVVRKVAELRPNDRAIGDELRRVYVNVASNSEANQNGRDAVAYYRLAIALAQAKLSTIPAVAHDEQLRSARQELFTLHRKTGDAFMMIDNPTQAMASYQEANTLMDQLTKPTEESTRPDPSLTVAQADLLRQMGLLSRNTGRSAEAAKYLARSVESRQRAADQLSDAGGKRSANEMLITTALELADLLASRGEADAIARYRQAAQAERSVARQPAEGEDEVYRSAARIFFRIGRASGDLADRTQFTPNQRRDALRLARESYAASLESLEKLRNRNQLTGPEVSMPDIIRARLGETERALAGLPAT